MKLLNTRIAIVAACVAIIGAMNVPAQFSPPTPFVIDDYNDDALANTLGGTVVQFYGGGNPFTEPGGGITLATVDAEGSQGGGAGDFALQVTDDGALLTFPDFTFFGFTVEIDNGDANPRNISGFENLEVSLKLGPTAGAHNDWGIRLEDASNFEEFNNVTLNFGTDLGGAPTVGSYTTYVIPLSDFTAGGGQIVDLSQVSQIVFASGATPAHPSGIEVDVFVDNIRFTGSSGSVIFDAPPIPLFEDYDDSDLTNNYGGESDSFYGGGDPFFQDDSQITNTAVDAEGSSTGLAGDFAWNATGNLADGPNTTFFGHQVTLGEGRNISGFFNTLRFDARTGTGTAFSDYRVRIEDGNPTGAGDFQNNSVALSDYGSLSTTYSTFEIPFEDLLGGAQDPELTTATTIVLFHEAATGSGPYEVNLFIDQFELLGIWDTPPTPFLNEYTLDGLDPAINNYGGGTQQFGDGSPTLTSTFPDMSGATGAAGDAAWRLSTDSGADLSGATFFGMFVELTPGDSGDVDISGFDRIIFDARVGTGTAYTDYGIRVEDTTGSSFNAFTLPLSNYGTLGTSYSRFEIPLADFSAGTGASGGDTAVDLTQVRVIVFPGTPTGTDEIDLFVDNLTVRLGPIPTGPSTAAQDWINFK
jgi:hypothetical protein